MMLNNAFTLQTVASKLQWCLQKLWKTWSEPISLQVIDAWEYKTAPAHCKQVEERAVRCAHRVQAVHPHYAVSLWRGHNYTLVLQRNSYFIRQKQEVITKWAARESTSKYSHGHISAVKNWLEVLCMQDVVLTSGLVHLVLILSDIPWA